MWRPSPPTAITGKEGAETPPPRQEPRVRALPGQRLVNLVVRDLLRDTRALSRLSAVVCTPSTWWDGSPGAATRSGSDGGDLFLGTSARWRHNLRAGQPVAARLRGKHRWADVTTYTKQADVVSVYASMPGPIRPLPSSTASA